MISRLYKAFFCKFVNSAQPIASPLPLYREEPTRKMFDKPVRELVIRSTGDFSHELPQFPLLHLCIPFRFIVFSAIWYGLFPAICLLNITLFIT